MIDKGVLRHVPYMSYKAGFCEFNIYGDLDAPCSIEMGVSGLGLRDTDRRLLCRNILAELLPSADDREILGSLSFSGGKRTRKGLTFEVTPETAEDAYGGWWISIYDESALDLSRASDSELKAVTLTKQETEKIEPESDLYKKDDTLWSREDLKYARTLTLPPSTPLPTYNSGPVYVKGYYRKNGTYVRGHTRRR